MDNSRPFQQALQFYFGSWIFGFVMTLVCAFCANTIWKIPLPQIVDVQLSVSFSILMLCGGIYLLVAVISLLTGHILAAIIWVFSVLFLSLSAYAPVLAFQLFGWITGQDPAAGSQLLEVFRQAETVVTLPIAQASQIVFTGQSLDALMNWAERGLQLASIIIAIGTLVSRRRDRAEAQT